MGVWEVREGVHRALKGSHYGSSYPQVAIGVGYLRLPTLYHPACISIALPVLLTSLSSVGLHLLGVTLKRGGYTLAHLYLGVGLVAPLRAALCSIEYLSGLFRAVSLSLRILCNSVAGHSLLLVLQALCCWAADHVPKGGVAVACRKGDSSIEAWDPTS